MKRLPKPESLRVNVDADVDDELRFGAWLSALWYDARYALRGIRKEPAFAAVVASTFGPGMGFEGYPYRSKPGALPTRPTTP
jgi:hypothetical protein